jgi:hypothetical protein
MVTVVKNRALEYGLIGAGVATPIGGGLGYAAERRLDGLTLAGAILGSIIGGGVGAYIGLGKLDFITDFSTPDDIAKWGVSEKGRMEFADGVAKLTYLERPWASFTLNFKRLGLPNLPSIGGAEFEIAAEDELVMFHVKCWTVDGRFLEVTPWRGGYPKTFTKFKFKANIPAKVDRIVLILDGPPSPPRTCWLKWLKVSSL